MCCLVWMLFIRECVYVLSGVDVVYTRICISAVWCECCLYENLVPINRTVHTNNLVKSKTAFTFQ